MCAAKNSEARCDVALLFHHQQYGRENDFFSRIHSQCVCGRGGVSLSTQAGCERKGVFISTVNSVDMRVYRQCGHKGVSLKYINQASEKFNPPVAQRD
jgi:hypothetical protein